MMKRRWIVSLILVAVPAIAGAATAFSPLPPDCQVSIDGYRHSTGYDEAGNRVLIEARRACAERPGLPLELHDVRLTVYRDGKVIERFENPRALMSAEQRKLLIRDVAEHSPMVTLDFPTGELRSTNGLYLDLRKRGADARARPAR